MRAHRGWVYLLSNCLIPGVVKIGMTCRDPEDRCRELSGQTACPFPFDLLCATRVAGRLPDIERAVHDLFACNRTMQGKEFFRARIDEAAGALRHLKSGVEFRVYHSFEAAQSVGSLPDEDALPNPWECGVTQVTRRTGL